MMLKSYLMSSLVWQIRDMQQLFIVAERCLYLMEEEWLKWIGHMESDPNGWDHWILRSVTGKSASRWGVWASVRHHG
ncbi:hypothetical protein DXT76_06650 [Halobacillus trueperi]|uniref:Uncharacterized protein n=1 Tax=Halobacillus trueperi TaxID=156205 RepID=A0A3D8VQZ1_9BACI|nr:MULTISPECIES: hypothetical protein [Halobacillus]RDY71677.1 hypothetical protein DXT76_06650 [Halobacillus trueperi]